jgi:hypothetical protein
LEFPETQQTKETEMAEEPIRLTQMVEASG